MQQRLKSIGQSKKKIFSEKSESEIWWFAKCRGAGTEGQHPLWSKAAFIARVWTGLDRQAISLTIVHLAFGNSHQRKNMMRNQQGGNRTHNDNNTTSPHSPTEEHSSGVVLAFTSGRRNFNECTTSGRVLTDGMLTKGRTPNRRTCTKSTPEEY